MFIIINYPLSSLFLDDQRTKNAVCDLVSSVKLCREISVACEVIEHIVALSFLIDLVSKTSLAPLVNAVESCVSFDYSLEVIYYLSNALFAAFYGNYKNRLVRLL